MGSNTRIARPKGQPLHDGYAGPSHLSVISAPSLDSINASPNMSESAPIRRLLIISYHFPPDGAIGGLRWAGLSKYLGRMGWDVHVVTASESAAENGNAGVHMHVRRRRRTLNDAYNAANGLLKRNAPSAAPASPPNASNVPQRETRGIATTLRRSAGAMLVFPDHGRGWVLRAAVAARALLRAERFDLVVTSGPPHSAHLAGVLATFGRREPLWLDMRDPWSEAVLAYSPDAIERFLTPRLERFVRQRARHATVTTAEFAATIRLSSPWLPVSHVSNGVDVEQLPPRREDPGPGCLISYVGTLYARRTLTVVLDALRDLVRDQPMARQAIRLHIAGNVDGVHRQRLNADLATNNILDLVELHGVIPRSAALDLLNRSHLALVLAQDQHLMIPAKLYESMALGVPTLVIAEPTSAAAREGRRIGALTVGVDDVEGIRRVIEDVLAGRLPRRVTASAPISHSELAAQFDARFREGDPLAVAAAALPLAPGSGT